VWWFPVPSAYLNGYMTDHLYRSVEKWHEECRMFRTRHPVPETVEKFKYISIRSDTISRQILDHTSQYREFSRSLTNARRKSGVRSCCSYILSSTTTELSTHALRNHKTNSRSLTKSADSSSTIINSTTPSISKATIIPSIFEPTASQRSIALASHHWLLHLH